MEKEMTLEKSQKVADALLIINAKLREMDIDYLRLAGISMIEAANRQDTLMVLNPSYPPEKSSLIEMQGRALILLANYAEKVNECTAMKMVVGMREAQQKVINELFI